MKSLLFLLALLLLFAGKANAQTLYKCVAGNGAVSWQSASCAHGVRTVKSLAYKPEAPQAVPASSSAPFRSTLGASKAHAQYRHQVSIRMRRSKPDACARVRAHRESTLEQVGLKRNYDLLSKLDADVRRVCR